MSEGKGAQHTPGPWQIDDSNESALIRGSDKAMVAKVVPLDCGEGEANACLIAAAPDLLEALKYIASCSAQHYARSVYPGEDKMVPVHNSDIARDHWIKPENFSGLIECARSAIARAEGEKE